MTEPSFSLNMIPTSATIAPCFDVDLICDLLILGGMEGLGHEVGLDDGHNIIDGLILDCDANGDGLAAVD